MVVIDVGVNRINDDTKEKRHRLVRDVAFDEVEPKVKAISPVPGGVGPMTITMLMKHAVRAAKRTLEEWAKESFELQESYLDSD